MTSGCNEQPIENGYDPFSERPQAPAQLGFQYLARSCYYIRSTSALFLLSRSTWVSFFLAVPVCTQAFSLVSDPGRNSLGYRW